MLKPLPIARPETVVFVQAEGRGAVALSRPTYRDLRGRNVTIDGLVGYRISPLNIDAGDAGASGPRSLAPAGSAVSAFDVDRRCRRLPLSRKPRRA